MTLKAFSQMLRSGDLAAIANSGSSHLHLLKGSVTLMVLLCAFTFAVALIWIVRVPMIFLQGGGGDKENFPSCEKKKKTSKFDLLTTRRGKE